MRANPGNSFTNSGTITAASSGGKLTIDATTFTNSGTLAASNGDAVTIEASTFTNLPAHTLAGGAYEAEAGSTLEIYSADTITTDDANIILSGAGSTIETYNTSTEVTSIIETTLTNIGTTGKFQLLARRNWTTANAAITNDGLIQLGGGTLKATGAERFADRLRGVDAEGVRNRHCDDVREFGHDRGLGLRENPDSDRCGQRNGRP